MKSLKESKGLERLGNNLIFTIGDCLSKLWSILGDRMGFPGGSEIKASACNVRDLGSIPGSGRCPGEGKGNPLQYSCLEDPMVRSLVGCSPWGCKELDMTERLHFK